MVRRLIHYFLRWLRQLLANVRGTKQRRHHPPALRQLPPARQHRTAADPARSPEALLPPKSHRAQQLDTIANACPPRTQEDRRQTTNPVEDMEMTAVNSSQFEVRLNRAPCSPNQAVQSLSHQLSHPDAHPDAQTEQTLSPEHGNTLNTPSADVNQLSAPDADNDNPTQLPHSPSPFLESAAPATTQWRSQSTIHTARPITALKDSEKDSEQDSIQDSVAGSGNITKPGSITKQGVVKLLFKLKKSNHHGYITPHDGSKDIIFHQKYIGNEVFSRLERGTEVEVTAHITEGKAYADYVRIL